jgi:two-component system sensor histidine kinase DesK
MMGRSRPASRLWWDPQRSRALLVAVHVPFLLVAPVTTASGLNNGTQNPFAVAALALMIGALQLRHSLATAKGERPRFWALTLPALGLLVFAPLIWFSYGWASLTWMFVASAAMLLQGRLRLALVMAPTIGIPLYVVVAGALQGNTVPVDFWVFVFWVAVVGGGAMCLYSAALLVRTVDALYATRSELAEVTLGQERLRLSRDLHDVLGQSLSAVSLKGDLAQALLRSGDVPAAEEEIRSLADVARAALRDVRQVVRDEHAVSLQSELRGAAELLAAASIAATIEVNVANLPPMVDELLGWATREGVTNLLRHSDATMCSIRAARSNAVVTFEIVNDGAVPTRGEGNGIPGLAERAQALAGSVTSGHQSPDRFRLWVEVPEGRQ